MISTKKYLILWCLLFSAVFVFGQNEPRKDQHKGEVYRLGNSVIELGIDLFGGAYVDLHLVNPKSVNPLTWRLSPSEMPPNNRDGAPFQGHFLCLGRWGSPTEGEIEQGVPHNGQPGNTMWKVKEQSDSLKLIMSNKAPLDGMKVERVVKLEEDKPVFSVVEKVTNITSVGRLNNIVQHVTLGPPFLNENMQVSCNAREGFLQEYCYPDPDQYAFCWPFARIDEKDVNMDLRNTHINKNYVSTHLVGDSVGWVAALQPERNLIIGYTWDTRDYPWINIWNQTDNGQPVAKGLEFGTTGIGKPYPDLLNKNTFFKGVPSYEFLDAGKTVVKSFTGFLTRVPPGFKNVIQVRKKGEKIVLIDKNGMKSVIGPGLEEQ
jgi:hypothetical protein